MIQLNFSSATTTRKRFIFIGAIIAILVLVAIMASIYHYYVGPASVVKTEEQGAAPRPYEGTKTKPEIVKQPSVSDQDQANQRSVPGTRSNGATNPSPGSTTTSNSRTPSSTPSSSGGGSTSPSPTPPSPQPLFTGNFETGNFSQWDICQTIVYNSQCSGYGGAHYALTLQSTVKRQGNWAARFEVRNGDQPFCCGERSELNGGNALTSTEGQDRWYQWSTLFQSGFPTSQGWSAIAQWHADADGSPPVAFPSSDDGLTDGYFGLIERRYDSPSQLLATNLIWQTPQNPGTWHTIKIHIKWSTSDSNSLIELWHNGVKQTFIGACAGQTQCKLRTMMPGGGDVYFKQGYYRDPNHTTTGVVYHDGFTMAATEYDLGSY